MASPTSSPESRDETTTGPYPRSSPEPFRVPQALSVLLASTVVAALATGVAFYMGWRYEKAYLEEWGLPFSAFSYAPTELMVASSTTLVWAVGLVAAVVLGEIYRAAVSLDSFLTPSHTPVAKVPAGVKPLPWFVIGACGVVAAGTLALVVIDALMTDQYRNAMNLFWIYLLLAIGGSWQLVRSGSTGARWFLASALIVAAFFFLAIAPIGLGRSDAVLDKEHVERLPRVEVVLAHSLGLLFERADGPHVVTGPWRVVRVNDGRLWLTDEPEDSDAVVSVAMDDVEAVVYLNDD
jgi:hypothetical protein